MEDNTTFIEKPKDDAKQVVETKVTSTSSHTGRPRRDGNIGGMSGRFWITLLLGFGLLALPVLYLISIMTGKTIDAATFLGVFTAYIGVAGMAVGTYLGQNQQPKPVV